jgi:hypothetical protein
MRGHRVVNPAGDDHGSACHCCGHARSTACVVAAIGRESGPYVSCWQSTSLCLECGCANAAQPGIHGVLVVGLPQAEAGFEQPRMAYLRAAV